MLRALSILFWKFFLSLEFLNEHSSSCVANSLEVLALLFFHFVYCINFSNVIYKFYARSTFVRMNLGEQIGPQGYLMFSNY